jgi:ubiquinone biosynthesis protein
VLLQKTLLNIEGLGRQLDPDLDLWKTAKPYLERWMQEQVGWRGLVSKLKEEAPRFNHIFPQLPRLIHQVLERKAEEPGENNELLKRLLIEQRRTNALLGFAVFFGSGLIAGVLLLQILLRWYRLPF